MSLAIKEMAHAHPGGAFGFDEILLACIEECLACFQACSACADACLAEPDVADLMKCIRTDLDCSDVCASTVNVLTRRTEWNSAVMRAVVEACLVSCLTCAEECERHALHHEHCRIAAEVCSRCERACRQLLAAMTPV
jgi:hypothetical protein